MDHHYSTVRLWPDHSNFTGSTQEFHTTVWPSNLCLRRLLASVIWNHSCSNTKACIGRALSWRVFEQGSACTLVCRLGSMSIPHCYPDISRIMHYIIYSWSQRPLRDHRRADFFETSICSLPTFTTCFLTLKAGRFAQDITMISCTCMSPTFKYTHTFYIATKMVYTHVHRSRLVILTEISAVVRWIHQASSLDHKRWFDYKHCIIISHHDVTIIGSYCMVQSKKSEES
jgi:hypothetical protein